jgi:hypothetical protein
MRGGGKALSQDLPCALSPLTRRVTGAFEEVGGVVLWGPPTPHPRGERLRVGWGMLTSPFAPAKLKTLFPR